MTFHNLSAPFTVDCEGAYIEVAFLEKIFKVTSEKKIQVERENNGFEARWCGNRVTQGGSRPHVIFARNEVCALSFGISFKNSDNSSPGEDNCLR